MLADGEGLNNTIPTGSMDDVGTRIKFLTELYELWQTGLDILERYDAHKPEYAVEKHKLEGAIDLLYFHITKDQSKFEDAVKINRVFKELQDLDDTTSIT